MVKQPQCWMLFALLGSACGQPLWRPPDRLPSRDTRHAYVGSWQVTFALDSTRDPLRRPAEWVPAPDTAKRIVGTLDVRDSLVGTRRSVLAATFEIDFVPLLGRPMSCLVPDGSGLQVTEEGGRATLWFTPGAFDCGFSGWATRSADTVVGTWEETSIVGGVARGRFWMWRG